jgi:hypothetical protein
VPAGCQTPGCGYVGRCEQIGVYYRIILAVIYYLLDLVRVHSMHTLDAKLRGELKERGDESSGLH